MNRCYLVLLILALPFLVAAGVDQYGAGAWRILKFLLTDMTCNAPGTCDLAAGTTIGGSPIGGGGGAPTTVNYLVGTADAGLSAEIAVGTTPGGELGGTWASPTIDSGVVDFSELSGSATDGQIPNTVTIDLATVATTANAGDSATAFFSSGTIEGARGGVGTALPTCSGTDKLTANGTIVSCATDQTGGGGGGNSVEQNVTCTQGQGFCTATVTGQAWVASGSEIVCGAYGSDLAAFLMQPVASDKSAGVGFTIKIYNPNDVSGTIPVHCIGV